jgi:hypothetical protein
VDYGALRQKLDALDQTLERVQGSLKGQKHSGGSVRWKSQDDWNSDKKGWEWLFPHIDTDTDGQISADEYRAFQQFKSEHEHWEDLLRSK